MPSAASPSSPPAGPVERLRGVRAAGALLSVTVVLSGCAEQHRDRTIREVRTIESPPPALGVPTAERLGFRSRSETPPTSSTPATDGFEFDLPAGWQRADPKPLRDVNLEAPGGVACWVSLLGPQPALPNLDRWRRQMGLEPATEAMVDGLPRVSLLGKEALEVDLVAADGSKRLIGRMLLEPDRSVFVRIEGEPPAVTAQVEAFDRFCASLRQGGTAANTAPPASAGGSAEGLTWNAPVGWREEPGSAFRLASFVVAPETQCWISLLGGDGGGLAANVARWCGQVGRTPFTAEQIASLPTIPMLGRDATWVELIDDGQDEGLLVVVCPQPELARTVFVKLQGPLSSVRKHADEFRRFCESIGAKEG